MIAPPVVKRYPESWAQKLSPELCEKVNHLDDWVRERRIFEALCVLMANESPERRNYILLIIEGKINIGS